MLIPNSKFIPSSPLAVISVYSVSVSLFQFYKYANKFGKLSSGHRTGKGQFSSQSPKNAMPKNAQITTQLHSSHMLVK